MAKSYFAILGLASGASAEEIHSAYRRLAKEYHPDHYSGGSGPFRQIQEAYSVLGNAHRRHEYEKVLSRPLMRRGARKRPIASVVILIFAVLLLACASRRLATSLLARRSCA